MALGALALLVGGCGREGGVQVPSHSLLVDLPTPAGWSRSAQVPVSTGLYADLSIEPTRSSYASPYGLVLTAPASGQAQASLALAYRDALWLDDAELVLDSSLSRQVQGNQGYLLQYRMPGTDGRVVRELFFLWRQHDCRIVLSRLLSDTASQRILRRVEDGVILD